MAEFCAQQDSKISLWVFVEAPVIITSILIVLCCSSPPILQPRPRAKPSRPYSRINRPGKVGSGRVSETFLICQFRLRQATAVLRPTKTVKLLSRAAELLALPIPPVIIHNNAPLRRSRIRNRSSNSQSQASESARVVRGRGRQRRGIQICCMSLAVANGICSAGRAPPSSSSSSSSSSASSSVAPADASESDDDGDDDRKRANNDSEADDSVADDEAYQVAIAESRQ